MSVDAEIRRLLTERRRRALRPANAPVERYHIQSRVGENYYVPVENGRFADEQRARSRMEKLRPRKGDCYTLYDVFGGGPRGRVLMQKGDCEEPKGKFECAGDCYSLDALFERFAVPPKDDAWGVGERTIAARRLWLRWVKKLKRAASRAETVGWGKSSFKADFATRQLKDVLRPFCKGSIPMPQEEADERFAALFELVLPNKTMGYPTGLAYTAQPVGSLRGTGVSPSAAGDIEAGRFQNYLDAGTIKSRKPGSKSSRIGGGKVVQHQKARS